MKNVLVCFGIFLLLFTPFSVSAEEKNTVRKLEEYIEESLHTYQIPGASLAIVENGELVYEDHWGIKSDGSAITGDTPFLIGSLSKPITSLAIMRLVEDGKIKLDEPIQTYIPSFTYHTDSSEQITVRNLLQQTSGISSFDGLKVTDQDTKTEGAISHAVTELNGVTLSHVPGEVYEYNSANYLLLGAIIEKVTNQTFSEFVSKEIFSPLGMSHSAADYEAAVAKGYVPGFESWFGKPISSDGLYDQAGAPYGYITSSATDLAKFLTFMLEGGDLLSEQNLQLLTSPPKEGKTYGLGWHFSKTDHFPFHGGATPDFRGEMFFIPEKKMAAVLLTNKYHITEDAQVSYMREGIRSIMNGTEPNELPAQSYRIQWIMLGTTLLFAILTVAHFILLRRKKIQNKKVFYSIGSMSLILSIAFIPLFIFIMKTPWKSVNLFAPDIAFLTYCLVVIFAINGNMPFLMTLNKKSVHEMYSGADK